MHETIAREIKDVELRMTLLEAELGGLEQRRKMLADAAAREGNAETGTGKPTPAVAEVDVAKLTLVDAVLHVMDESRESMRIEDVVGRLRELGRTDNEGSIPPTLNYLYNNRKVRRLSRGLYGSTKLGSQGAAGQPMAARPDSQRAESEPR
jgi:hypothetical protein